MARRKITARLVLNVEAETDMQHLLNGDVLQDICDCLKTATMPDSANTVRIEITECEET